MKTKREFTKDVLDRNKVQVKDTIRKIKHNGWKDAFMLALWLKSS
jgi:hypothetical protein